ncbi:hypothetical protein BGZ81_001261 [Podila clonocystis]|nr:hypothetical protein BGZ81_001261 [Podila clonocystis]
MPRALSLLSTFLSFFFSQYLYKYPQAAFPYEQLVRESTSRNRTQPEYELLDTGIFNEDKYFDVYVEYAKDAQDVDDILVKITAFNRGKNDAPLTILPQFCFRNTWAWFPEGEVKVPSMKKVSDTAIEADHESLGKRWIHFGPSIVSTAATEVTCSAPETATNIASKKGTNGTKATSTSASAGTPGPTAELIFTNNESNVNKLFKDKNKSTYVKDAFHEYVVQGQKGAINTQDFQGTKAAGVYRFDKVPAGGYVQLRVRLNKTAEPKKGAGVDRAAFDKVLEERFKECNDFYKSLALKNLSPDLAGVQRQAFAGMLWSKQWYHFDQRSWRKGDPVGMPPPEARKNLRNKGWKHLYIEDVLSMPDKWEYPFFAAWDMAFHAIPLSIVDPFFAKKQLDLLTREWYMHPSGQIPAYEWNFSDVNPRMSMPCKIRMI